VEPRAAACLSSQKQGGFAPDALPHHQGQRLDPKKSRRPEVEKDRAAAERGELNDGSRQVQPSRNPGALAGGAPDLDPRWRRAAEIRTAPNDPRIVTAAAATPTPVPGSSSPSPRPWRDAARSLVEVPWTPGRGPWNPLALRWKDDACLFRRTPSRPGFPRCGSP